MEKKFNKVAIMGGGNSAQALAADFTLAGYKTNLGDLPNAPLSDDRSFKHVLETKKILKVGVGMQGIAKLNMVTTDLSEAINGVDVIILAIPQVAQMPFYEAIADYLEDGQIVVTIPGNWGALKLYNLLKKKGINNKVKIAQTNSCMQIARAAESFLVPGVVRQLSKRTKIQISAMPGKDTIPVYETLKPMWNILVPAINVLETSLNSSNLSAHGPMMVMNAGWIENPNYFFKFYRDGNSPSIGRVVDTIERERNVVMNALKITPPPAGGFYKGVKAGKWIHDPSQFKPTTMKHRYTVEDVPHAMVPMSELGDLVEVPTPATDAIIELSSISNEINYWKEGTTLKSLELSGLTLEEILVFLDTGEK